MFYTVGEMAKILNTTPSTLRYYDKEGLLPFVERSESGIRMFKDSDYEWLLVIDCLKNTGMGIKDIKRFIEMVIAGDSTIKERLQMIIRQREALRNRMENYSRQWMCWIIKYGITALPIKQAQLRCRAICQKNRFRKTCALPAAA